MSTWLDRWEPENPDFWKSEGSRIAWRTLILTTFSLIFSFATWFVPSALVVRMPAVGFTFTKMQLFWLAATPGLAGGSLRLIHSFLIPIFGTRMTITVATFLKLIPMAWLYYAIQNVPSPDNPGTSFATFVVIFLLCGFGGGDFSSYMPSSSLFFPKRLQGTAMGIQAGVGNFGVSLVQFVTPWIVGFAAFGALSGAPQVFTKADGIKEIVVTKAGGVVTDVVVTKPELAASLTVTKAGGLVTDVALKESDATKGFKVEIRKDAAGAVADVQVKKSVKKDMWLQNAAFWYIPFLLISGVLCGVFLRSVPIKASFSQQFDIMKDKHTWFCVITYFMTFGSFAGFSAAFPLMIKTIYGDFPGAPDPLKYAFLGPLIGSSIRFLGGPLSDRWGGSIWTQLSGLGLIGGCLALIFGGLLTPTSLAVFPYFLGVMLWIFLMAGIGNFATFRQYPIIFAFSPRQGAQVLGWTGAWAAFGPFVFSSLIGKSITDMGSAKAFFVGAAIFYAVATAINWWYYTRLAAERYDFGTWRGTWWDKARDTWPQ